jgi:hypothetical protein
MGVRSSRVRSLEKGKKRIKPKQRPVKELAPDGRRLGKAETVYPVF